MASCSDLLHYGKCVWALLDEQLTEHVILNTCPDAKVWLFTLMESTSKYEFAVILTTLWAIWWAGRNAIHEEKYQSPLSTFAFIQRFLEDLSMTEVASEDGAGTAQMITVRRSKA